MSRQARHRNPRSRRLRTTFILVLALAMVAGGSHLMLHKPSEVDRPDGASPTSSTPVAMPSPAPSSPEQITSLPPTPQQATVRKMPTPGVGSSPTPLGTPPAIAKLSDSWAPSRTQTDQHTPVTWDRCRAIHYVTRPDGAPRGGQQLLARAIAEVSADTGFQFIDDGTTDESYAFDRPSYQTDRYGDRWAPVLITWASPREVKDLRGNVIAQAGASPARVGSSPTTYVTGSMQLDAPQIEQALDDGQRKLVYAVMLHELGHLVGLAHVDDSDQLMYDQTSPDLTNYAAGDRTGLAAMGSGPCVPQL